MFSKFINQKKGFTLVELLITITVIGIISAYSVPYFSTYITKKDLDYTTSEIHSFIKKAIINSRNQYLKRYWGVYFIFDETTKSYTLSLKNYSSSDISNLSLTNLKSKGNIEESKVIKNSTFFTNGSSTPTLLTQKEGLLLFDQISGASLFINKELLNRPTNPLPDNCNANEIISIKFQDKKTSPKNSYFINILCNNTLNSSIIKQ